MQGLLNKLQLSLILLLLIARSNAQSVEVKAGSSSLYGGYGGAVDIYLKNHQINLSGATQNGILQFGLTDRFDWKKIKFAIGDSSFNYSVDGSGLGVQVRGLTIQKKNLSVFAGQTGVQTLLPYYSTFKPQHTGIGLFWCKKHKKLEFRSLNVLSGGKKTSLQSIKYVGKYFQGSTSAGWYQGQKQITGIGMLNLGHVSLAVNRTQQTYQSTPLTTNAAAATFHVERFSVSGALSTMRYGGSTVTGRTASASFKAADWLSLGYSYYGSAGQKLHQVNVTETSRLITAQEAIDNQKHLSGNVTVNTHLLTVSIGRTELLMPKRGWVSSTVFSVGLKIHDTAVSISRLFLPDGSHKMTVNGSDWIYSDKARVNEPTFAKYVVEGTVKDESGNPVAGVPVKIGKVVCFSDRDGNFYLRVKHRKPYMIEVDVDGFMMSGKIKVIKADNHITPGQKQVEVIVSRM